MQSHPMQIKKLESFTTPEVGFIIVTTACGATGLGQMSTYHADITAQIFHRQVAPWVLGRVIDFDNLLAEALDIAALVNEREHKYPGSYIRRALAGLYTALWDLAGKVAGRSVASLIGGGPGPVRAYASSMKRDITPDDEAARLVRLRDEAGFDAFKFRIGAECGRGADEWPGRTEQIIPTLSRALGDDVVRMVDANSCFGVDRAIEVGHMLVDHGITHYEEPCPYWQPDQTRQVTAALADMPIDVTGGEQDCDKRHWDDMMRRHIVDVLQPDIMYMGGLSPTLALASAAARAPVPKRTRSDHHGYIITPHAANLSLVTMCTMHMLTAIPNAGPYLEYAIEGADYYPWTQDLLRCDLHGGDPFAVSDGKVTVTDAPGWGVTVNPAFFDKASYDLSEME